MDKSLAEIELAIDALTPRHREELCEWLDRRYPQAIERATYRRSQNNIALIKWAGPSCVRLFRERHRIPTSILNLSRDLVGAREVEVPSLGRVQKLCRRWARLKPRASESSPHRDSHRKSENTLERSVRAANVQKFPKGGHPRGTPAKGKRGKYKTPSSIPPHTGTRRCYPEPMAKVCHDPRHGRMTALRWGIHESLPQEARYRLDQAHDIAMELIQISAEE